MGEIKEQSSLENSVSDNGTGTRTDLDATFRLSLAGQACSSSPRSTEDGFLALTILDLPPNVWVAIGSLLSTRAIEALRLTCRDAANLVDARLIHSLRLTPTVDWLLQKQRAGVTCLLPRRFCALSQLLLRPASAHDFVRRIDLSACLTVLGPCPALHALLLGGWPGPHHQAELYGTLPKWAPALTTLILDGVAGGLDSGGVAALAALPHLRRLGVRFRGAAQHEHLYGKASQPQQLGPNHPPRACPDLGLMTQLTALQLVGVQPNQATVLALAPLTGLRHLHLEVLHDGYDKGMQVLNLQGHTRLASLVFRAQPFSTSCWRLPLDALSRASSSPLPCPAALRSTLQHLPPSLESLAVDLPPWRPRGDASWAVPDATAAATSAATVAAAAAGPRRLAAASSGAEAPLAAAFGAEAAGRSPSDIERLEEWLSPPVTPQPPALRLLACPPELLPCLRDMGFRVHRLMSLRLCSLSPSTAPTPLGLGGSWGCALCWNPAAPPCWPYCCCGGGGTANEREAGAAARAGAGMKVWDGNAVGIVASHSSPWILAGAAGEDVYDNAARAYGIVDGAGAQDAPSGAAAQHGVWRPWRPHQRLLEDDRQARQGLLSCRHREEESALVAATEARVLHATSDVVSALRLLPEHLLAPPPQCRRRPWPPHQMGSEAVAVAAPGGFHSGVGVGGNGGVIENVLSAHGRLRSDGDGGRELGGLQPLRHLEVNAHISQSQELALLRLLRSIFGAAADTASTAIPSDPSNIGTTDHRASGTAATANTSTAAGDNDKRRSDGQGDACRGRTTYVRQPADSGPTLDLRLSLERDLHPPSLVRNLGAAAGTALRHLALLGLPYNSSACRRGGHDLFEPPRHPRTPAAMAQRMYDNPDRPEDPEDPAGPYRPDSGLGVGHRGVQFRSPGTGAGFFGPPRSPLVAALRNLLCLRTLTLHPVLNILLDLQLLAGHPSLRVLRLQGVQEDGASAAERPLLPRLKGLMIALGDSQVRRRGRGGGGGGGGADGQRWSCGGVMGVPGCEVSAAGAEDEDENGNEGYAVGTVFDAPAGESSPSASGPRRQDGGSTPGKSIPGVAPIGIGAILTGAGRPRRVVLVVPQLQAWEVELLNREVEAATGGGSQCECIAR